MKSHINCNTFLEKIAKLKFEMYNFSIESVVLGGTHQEGDYDTTVYEKDKKFISEGCQRLYPSLNVSEPNF